MLIRRKRCLLRFPNISLRAMSLKGYSRPRSRGKAFTPRLRFILLICFTVALVLSALVTCAYHTENGQLAVATTASKHKQWRIDLKIRVAGQPIIVVLHLYYIFCSIA